MNTQTVVTALVGIVLIVGGGFLSKYISVEAGTALIAAGGWALGWLKTQPAFAQKKDPDPVQA